MSRTVLQSDHYRRLEAIDLASKPRPGFTLLEVLVALAVVAAMSLGLYGSLAVAFHAERAGKRAVEPSRQVDAVFASIRDDLDAIVIPNRGLLSGEFVGEDFGINAARLSFHTAAGVGEIEVPNPDQDPLQAVGGLTRLLAQQPDRIGSDIVGVTYQLATTPSPGSPARLLRLVQRNLLSPVESEPTAQVICDNVISFEVRFYDGQNWRQAWDSVYEDEITGSLPEAIEVAMEVAVDALDSQGPILTTRRWSRVFRLPMARHTGEVTVR